MRMYTLYQRTGPFALQFYDYMYLYHMHINIYAMHTPEPYELCKLSYKINAIYLWNKNQCSSPRGPEFTPNNRDNINVSSFTQSIY